MAPAEIQKRQVGAGDVEEEPVFYTAVGKEVLQVVGEEVGNADGLRFLPDGRPPGHARPPGSLQSSAFRHGAGPAGMGGKMLGAAGGF